MRTFTNKKAVPVKQTSKTKATVCQKKLAVILILSNAGTSFDDYFQVHSTVGMDHGIFRR